MFKSFALIALLASMVTADSPYHPAPYHPAPYHPAPYHPPAPHYEEPAKPYAFEYGVHDDYTGTNFNAQESTDGKATHGSYQVALPDGRIQTVTYTADDYNGYVAEVSYEGKPAYPEYKPHHPAPHHPAPHHPAPYHPAPAYKPKPHPHPAPVYHEPAPYHPAPVYHKPAPYHSAPVYHKPAPYHPAPVYHKPAPYHF